MTALAHGWIVRFASPRTDFAAALAAGLRPLLADLRALACTARDEGCSLGFLL